MRLDVEDFDTIANYIQLAMAVVRLVAQDYVNAQIGLRHDPDNWRLKVQRNDCMMFFNSKEFEAYSLGADPEYVVKALDEMVERGERIVTRIGAKHNMPMGVEDDYTMSEEDYARYYQEP